MTEAAPLLDANVLIALAVREHEHHGAVAQWAGATERIAVCPIVEGALVRFLVRDGKSLSAGTSFLTALEETGRCDFWPDDLSYRDLHVGHVQGHRQVTDAYLVGLASARGSVLATLDQALARAFPAATILLNGPE